MSDSTQHLDLIATAQAQKEATANELFDAMSPAALYARRDSTVSGHTWGYYGGRWNALSVANGTVALTASTTNYVVAARATGVVTSSTATTNWLDTTNYATLYKIVTSTTGITSYEDHRIDGLFGGGGGGTTTFVAPRVASSASSTTPTPDVSTTDVYILTALTDNATFGAPTGSPVQGQALLIRIKDDSAGPYTLAFNAIYRALGVTLPTTTVSAKTMYLGCIYNSTDSKWDVVAVREQA